MADPGFSPGGGAPTPKNAIIFQFFAENCMKMKEFGPPGGGGASLAPPLGSANDYALSGDQWKIGISSMFTDALGIASFKDNFWTTTKQPGNPLYSESISSAYLGAC